MRPVPAHAGRQSRSATPPTGESAPPARLVKDGAKIHPDRGRKMDWEARPHLRRRYALARQAGPSPVGTMQSKRSPQMDTDSESLQFVKKM